VPITADVFIRDRGGPPRWVAPVVAIAVLLVIAALVLVFIVG
jgi:hypothetical protein